MIDILRPGRNRVDGFREGQGWAHLNLMQPNWLMRIPTPFPLLPSHRHLSFLACSPGVGIAILRQVLWWDIVGSVRGRESSAHATVLPNGFTLWKWENPRQHTNAPR